MAQTERRMFSDVDAAEIFRAILALPEEKLLSINAWLQSHLNTLFEGELDTTEVRALVNEIGVPRIYVLNALALVTNFFLPWWKSGKYTRFT